MIEGSLQGAGLKRGFEASHKTFDLGQFGSEVDPDVFVTLDRFDKAPQVFLDIFSLPGSVKVASLTAKCRSLLDDVHLIALVAERLCRHHTGDAAADHEHTLVDIQHGFREGFHES